jgi:restriction system protein
LEGGVSALALGIAFLVAPAFISNPVLHGALSGLRAIAWLLILVGIGLMVLLKATGDRQAGIEPRRSDSPSSPRPSQPAPLRVVPSGSPTTDGRATQAAATLGDASAPERPTAWSAAVFDVIEWRRFEALCEWLFGQAGFETKSQSHGADGGIDIWLHSKNYPDGPVKVVQCKHWSRKQVGVGEVRALLGSMTDRKVKRGIFATTSVFTDDAKAFARHNGIQLLDRRGLLELIAQRTPEQQQELLAVATQGEFWIPTCASCGIKMTRRSRKSGGSQFWGCVNFPRCKTVVNG